jgi:hypothetical protein
MAAICRMAAICQIATVADSGEAGNHLIELITKIYNSADPTHGRLTTER